eukprot:g6387.t1
MPKISDKRNLHRDPETWVNCACEQCTKPIRQTQAVMCYVCQDEHQHWVCSAFCNQRFMKSGDKRVKELKHMSKVRLNGFLLGKERSAKDVDPLVVEENAAVAVEFKRRPMHVLNDGLQS